MVVLRNSRGAVKTRRRKSRVIGRYIINAVDAKKAEIRREKNVNGKKQEREGARKRPILNANLMKVKKLNPVIPACAGPDSTDIKRVVFLIRVNRCNPWIKFFPVIALQVSSDNGQYLPAKVEFRVISVGVPLPSFDAICCGSGECIHNEM